MGKKHIKVVYINKITRYHFGGNLGEMSKVDIYRGYLKFYNAYTIDVINNYHRIYNRCYEQLS